MASMQEIEQQARVVRGLQRSVYSQSDPTSNQDLLAQLHEAEAALAKMQTDSPSAGGERDSKGASKKGNKHGRFLGKATTGLSVECKLRMDPLPTGAYHLMDPETDPLLTVEVENASREIRRVCVRSYLEGISSQAIRTIEIEPREKESFSLQPTLFPERVRNLTEIQRATLHVIVEDLDGKLECHDTYPITCLSRNSSFNGVVDPETGQSKDFSHYYGAWVTPYVPAVQEQIRLAAEFAPDHRLAGYQGNPDHVVEQVAAMYRALRESNITYVNSVIDYGAAVGATMQRTRLPRESIEQKAANCIDGTVLMASLMEGASLNPAIVLKPGHAFVGWEVWSNSDEWRFLETTMIGSAEFEDACKSGERQYEDISKYNAGTKLSLADLRAKGIWPME